jgi:hypothetical protein
MVEDLPVANREKEMAHCVIVQGNSGKVLFEKVQVQMQRRSTSLPGRLLSR